MKKLFLLFIVSSLSFTALWGLSLQDLSYLKEQKIAGKFTQIKKIQGFEKELVSSGEFRLENKTLFYHIQSPINQQLKMNEQGVFVLENGAWLKQSKDYDKSLFLDIIELDFEKLQKSFKITLKGDKNAWSVQLKPINLVLEKIFDKIEIYGSKRVEKVILIEKNGDITQNIFSEF